MNTTFINIVPRKHSSNQTLKMPYRFGFNGKENDNEVKGTGNQLDFGARIYDPRLGRFLSIDSLVNKFPSISPYLYANNCPIYFIDQDGESGVAYKTKDINAKTGRPILKVVSNIYIYGSGATPENRTAIENQSNAQWNNNGNNFTYDDNGTVYDVVFEIKVEIISEDVVESKMVEGDYFNLNAENNFYEVRDDVKDNITLSGKNGGNTGVLKTSDIENRSPVHEQNHGYGGQNKDLPSNDYSKTTNPDIAVQGKNTYNPKDRVVTQDNIDAILKKVIFDTSGKGNVGNATPYKYDYESETNYKQVPKP